ncbi:MAG: hypothetical protein WDZ74_00460 [Candidatus Paceibacterota bacterium]
MKDESEQKGHLDPLWFGGRVDYPSVNRLVDQITELTPEEGMLEVIISSFGGYNIPAIDFEVWLSRFERKGNLRAIAGTVVASAGLTLFLGFERRTAIQRSVLRFHHLSLSSDNNDSMDELQLKQEELSLIDFVEKRTGFTRAQIKGYMDDRTSLSGEDLFLLGLCNERL